MGNPPDDGGGRQKHIPASKCIIGSNCGFQVPLHHLKQFFLGTNLHYTLSLLQQSEFPGEMDNVELDWAGSTPQDVTRVTGPCIQGQLQDFGGSRTKLSISVISISRTLVLKVAVVGTGVQLAIPSRWFRTHLTPTSSLMRKGLICFTKSLCSLPGNT